MTSDLHEKAVGLIADYRKLRGGTGEEAHG
jgi:hypothetical protein